MMRKIVFLCAAWFCVASAHALVFAEIKPRPGSVAALNTLVNRYRAAIAGLLEFEAEAGNEILYSNAYRNYRDQVLESVLLGLDNTDNNAANQLVIDLSTVYLGETASPLYSCLVQRKAKKLARYIKNGHSLSSNWCSEISSGKFCYEDKSAPIGKLRGNIGRAGNPECDQPLYPF